MSTFLKSIAFIDVSPLGDQFSRFLNYTQTF